MAYDPADWQNFYVMTGGAAAALTGLLFVAMSLHARTIMGNRFYSNRAVGTLTSLTAQLFLAAAVLIPGQSVAALGAEVEVAALFFLGVTIRAILWRGPSTGASPMTRTRRLLEIIGGSTWNVLFVASGISLIVRYGGGFYVLAAVMLLMFGWNIYVAWVLITEVSE